MSSEILELFARTGRDLFLSGAVTSHGGNLSVRDGDTIYISRRSSMLGRMGEGDVIATSINECADDAQCSRELVVHRAIYQSTDAKAIVHAHTVHTIFRSLIEDAIEPIDSETRYLIGPSIPVLAPQEKISSPEAAEMLSAALQHVSIAVLRSHGPFAMGETLEEAFYRVSALEASAQILDLRDSVGRPTLD
jgi:L-fuculose-phosphate aldolase